MTVYSSLSGRSSRFLPFLYSSLSLTFPSYPWFTQPLLSPRRRRCHRIRDPPPSLRREEQGRPPHPHEGLLREAPYDRRLEGTHQRPEDGRIFRHQQRAEDREEAAVGHQPDGFAGGLRVLG